MITTICVLVSAISTYVKGNIWDNIYSKYDIPLVPMNAVYIKSFDLQELSSILPARLRTEYRGMNNSVAVSVYLADSKDYEVKAIVNFNDNYLHVLYNNSCVYTDIPRQYKIDITDLNNILRYATYYSHDEGSNRVLEVNLMGLEDYIHTKVPQVFFVQSHTGSIVSIKVKLIDEYIVFNQSKGEGEKVPQTEAKQAHDSMMEALDKEKCKHMDIREIYSSLMRIPGDILSNMF